MLKNTFCHIPGVGPKTEQRFWDSGILTWEDCVDRASIPSKCHIKGLVEESLRRLEKAEARYFTQLLPLKELIRIYPHFRQDIAYLDIETNGLMGAYGYITAVTLYDGKTVRTYVRGENLDKLKKDIFDYEVLVTYNGRYFDIPFIESHLKVDLSHMAHIDLRFVLRDLGFKGGLKGCEKSLGIERGALSGLDGYSAVLLWNEYKRHRNTRALETLLAYNVQDVINLEPLSVMAYNLKIGSTPFRETHGLHMPKPPESPFKPAPEVVEMILSRRMDYL